MVLCDWFSDRLRTGIEWHHFRTKVIFVDTKKKAELLPWSKLKNQTPVTAFNFSPKNGSFTFGCPAELREPR
jgi:hypothetical protein